MYDDLQDFFEFARDESLAALNQARKDVPLFVTASFNLGHKTVSEIGGRFIEEYVTQNLSHFFSKHRSLRFEYLPSRSLGDFKIESKENNAKVLFVDIKAQHLTIRQETEKYYKLNNIKQKKPGESHPNLISFDKAKSFYSDASRINEDIAILSVKYIPKIRKERVDFEIQELDEGNLFLLRTLSESNLSYGSLGKGQIQLSRVNAISFEHRSKETFLKLLKKIASRPRVSRLTSSS